MGRSQVVRQRILIPPFGGSSAPAPASKSYSSAATYQFFYFLLRGHSECRSAPHSECSFPARSLIGEHAVCELPKERAPLCAWHSPHKLADSYVLTARGLDHRLARLLPIRSCRRVCRRRA